MPLDWTLDSAVALEIAWPEIAAQLGAIPEAERPAWARQQHRVRADLGDFFPADKPRRKRKAPSTTRPIEPTVVADSGNVVSWHQYRQQRLMSSPETPAA